MKYYLSEGELNVVLGVDDSIAVDDYKQVFEFQWERASKTD